MDVVRCTLALKFKFVAIATISLIALGCNQSKKAPIPTSPPPKFHNITTECSPTAIVNRFVVRWNDGSISVEQARDRDAFVRDVLEPYQDEIDFAENDQIVRLQDPAQASEPGTLTAMSATVATDWGQQMVEAPAVWQQGVRGKDVTVAIIDSGADITHPQLQPRLATNANETANGVDDDGNGLIDDINGYDFEMNSGDVRDGAGHGTHVAGIVLADHTAGDVRGIAPEAKLLPLDFMNDQGEGSISAAISAIHYAVSRGAKVINASWGGGQCSDALLETVRELESKGILFVVAAGNAGRSLESKPEYPAAFKLTGQLTVAASSTRDIMAGFSNFSYALVQLAAPGVSIVSTYPGSRMAAMSGTSMAAPFVSGAAALLFSYRPNATVADVRNALMQSVDLDPKDPQGTMAVATGGRMNIRKAVEKLTQLVP